jgi:hypothetical protein
MATPTADRKAAHAFLSELRTRITTQTLPYQQGVEAKALESLHGLFDHARAAMQAHPGCDRFAAAVSAVLNCVVRPVTGAWHKAHEQGLLLSRDGGDAFRADLCRVQQRLRRAARGFARMAYGRDVVDALVGPAIAPQQIDEVMRPVAFGVLADALANGGIDADTATNIAERERASVLARRRQREAHPVAFDAFGLALSGGGIRSATFCLGVVQILAHRRMLGEVDYLSTVSGGGFAGSFLTSRLHAGTRPEDLGAPHGPDPHALQVVRRRAQYLGGSILHRWRMAVETVLGMCCNWCVPLVLLGAAAVVAVVLGRAGAFDWLTWLVVATAVVTGAAGWVFFWVVRKPSQSPRKSGATIAGGSFLFVAVLVAWGIDHAFQLLLPGLQGSAWSLAALRLAIHDGPLGRDASLGWFGAAALGSLVPALLRFLPLLERPMVRKAAMLVALAIAGVAVPVLGLCVFLALYTVGGVRAGAGAGPLDWVVWLGMATAALGALLALVVNINATSPHRIYRRGLSRTFVEPALVGAHVQNRRLPLAELADHGPYHLVNATVNLPRSTHPTLRDRGCDFFLLSKHFLGSPAVRYAPTAQWRMDTESPDLATAMAISGAAFSSNMGLGSIAPLRALLAFLNVRLGYWIHHPRHARRCWLDAYPRFLCLLYEMTGWNLHHDQPWLNLSDGGHIENLGVYELLRRRCKFVVCVDGESDPQHTFHGLMTMVRHAQIDLGVRIAPDLRELRPDPKTGVCRSHYHLCRIAYPPRAGGGEQEQGLLLYLKLSLTGNEGELVTRYRGQNPTFPHQTTLDQFFDDEQFEAYRQLGVHVAEGLFGPAMMQDHLGNETSPVRVREWFRRLAEKLLPG